MTRHGAEERPVTELGPRHRPRRLVTVACGALLISGVGLVVVTLLDGALIRHRYWFLATEEFPLAVAASICLVGAANCWLWRRYLTSLAPETRVFPDPGWPALIGGGLLSVFAVGLIVMALMAASIFLPSAT